MEDFKSKVLIVDDRIHEIEWLIRFLSQELHCDISHRDNEKDTRDHFSGLKQSSASMPYSLAIIDIMIPVAKLEDLVVLDEEYLEDSRDTGIRLCNFIRNELKITEDELPIIAMSARTDDELIQQLDRLGIQLFSRDDLGIRAYLTRLLGPTS